MPGQWRPMLLPVLLFAALEACGGWFCDAGQGERALPESAGLAAVAEADFPGAVLIGRKANPETFRPERADFEYSEFFVELRLTGVAEPLRMLFFCKDRDGVWFQSVREYRLEPGEWRTFSIRIDR